MDKQTEALKLALEALEIYATAYSDGNEAIAAIREALADKQPAQQQEPVCDKDPQGCWSVRCQLGKVCKNTSPPASKPWVGLTKKEVHDLYDSDYAVFHQRIEAKLREKNA